MFLNRRLPKSLIFLFALRTLIWSTIWALFIFALYAFVGWQFLRIPFLPISTIGIAVAFYVGFKSNGSYDRFWEGRKIWGGVVNASRTWATYVISYILPGDTSEEAKTTRQDLIYRHLAWTNALRLQLRKTSRFFNKPARTTKRRLDKHAEHMRNDWDLELSPFLQSKELQTISSFLNPATHLLTKQGTQLADLHANKKLDLFHQISLMGVLQELYALQGKCERIKNTPFPRQFAEFSRIFVRLFVFLLPFGLLDVFADYLDIQTSLSGTFLFAIPMIVSSVLITWVFTAMEAIGDACEDPFERSMHDVPISALCRTIELDLRQMLGEIELPPKEQAIDGILY